MITWDCLTAGRSHARGAVAVDIKSREITSSAWINSSGPLSPSQGTLQVGLFHQCHTVHCRTVQSGSTKTLNHDFFFPSKRVRVAHSQSFAPQQALGIPPSERRHRLIREGGPVEEVFLFILSCNKRLVNQLFRR